LPSENKLTRIFDVAEGVVREAFINVYPAKGIIEIKKSEKEHCVLSPFCLKHFLNLYTALINYICWQTKGF